MSDDEYRSDLCNKWSKACTDLSNADAAYKKALAECTAIFESINAYDRSMEGVA